MIKESYYYYLSIYLGLSVSHREAAAATRLRPGFISLVQRCRTTLPHADTAMN